MAVRIGGLVRLFGIPAISPSRILVVLALVAAGYALFSTTGYVLRSYDLGRREGELRREMLELERQRAELEALRAYLQSDEYVEYAARKFLGLVRPGETLVLVSGAPQASASVPEEGAASEEPWWRRLYGDFWPSAAPGATPTATPSP